MRGNELVGWQGYRMVIRAETREERVGEKEANEGEKCCKRGESKMKGKGRR